MLFFFWGKKNRVGVVVGGGRRVVWGQTAGTFLSTNTCTDIEVDMIEWQEHMSRVKQQSSSSRLAKREIW